MNSVKNEQLEVKSEEKKNSSKEYTFDVYKFGVGEERVSTIMRLYPRELSEQELQREEILYARKFSKDMGETVGVFRRKESDSGKVVSTSSTTKSDGGENA